MGITACRFYSSIYPERLLPIWALGSSHFILNLQGFLNAVVFCSVSHLISLFLFLFYVLLFFSNYNYNLVSICLEFLVEIIWL